MSLLRRSRVAALVRLGRFLSLLFAFALPRDGLPTLFAVFVLEVGRFGARVAFLGVDFFRGLFFAVRVGEGFFLDAFFDRPLAPELPFPLRAVPAFVAVFFFFLAAFFAMRDLRRGRKAPRPPRPRRGMQPLGGRYENGRPCHERPREMAR